MAEDAFALDAKDFKLLAAIALHANPAGLAFPTRGKLASLVPCSVRTVERRLKSLKARGWLEWKKGASGRANEYRLLRHPLAQSDISDGQGDKAVSPAERHPGVAPTDHLTNHLQQREVRDLFSEGGSSRETNLKEREQPSDLTRPPLPIVSAEEFAARFKDDHPTDPPWVDRERELAMSEYLSAFLTEHCCYPDYEFASWTTEQFRSQAGDLIPW